MLRTKLGLAGAVLLSVSTLSTESRAGLVSLCEWQPSIDYECVDCVPTSNNLPVAIFNYPNASSLKDISQIEFTMSMQVGDPTASNLTLGIDGIDTGIALTGFERDTLVEKTVSLAEGEAGWISSEKESEILAALQDGEVFASIMGATPEDLKVQLYSDTNVQLCITGNEIDPVPEPASLLAWAVGGLVVLRRRKNA